MISPNKCIRCKSDQKIIYPYTNGNPICCICFDRITPKFVKSSEEQLLSMYSIKDNKIPPRSH